MPTWLLPTLHGYRRGWLRADIVAGCVAGTVVIPQAMAYASLAGLPVEIGLATCLLPALAYVLLGGSHSLSLSTTSTAAVLTASTLATVPGEPSVDDLSSAAFTLACLVGVLLLLLRLLRLGSLVEQISPATMTGVKAGIGLTVAVTQLPALLGVPDDPDRGGFFGRLGDLFGRVDAADPTTMTVAAAAVIGLVLIGRLLPRLPAPLVVTAAGIVLTATTDIEERGLAIVGDVPGGLPGVVLPVWELVPDLLPGAFAIALMTFIETIVVARGQRQHSESTIDSDRELLALGVAAVAGGLTQAMPPSGGLSQSAVNQHAGARSQVAGLTTAALALLVALFLGSVLAQMPEAVLAAIVLVSAAGLVSVPAFREMLAIDRTEFWIAGATALLGLTVGLPEAVVMGVLLTLVLVLRETNEAPVRALVRTTDGWRPAPLGTAVVDDTGTLLLHLEQTIYTGNARPVQDAVLTAVLSQDPPPRRVVLEGVQVRRATLPFIATIRDLSEHLHHEGVDLVVAALPAPVAAHARRSSWFDQFARSGQLVDAVDEALDDDRSLPDPHEDPEADLR